MILNKINIFSGENVLLEFHFDEWLAALILDHRFRLVWGSFVLNCIDCLKYKAKNIPPVSLQACHLVLEVHSVRVYLLHCVIDGSQSLILIHHLLSMAEWVVEVIQDFERLKVLLLIINYCLKTSLFTNSLYFIRDVLEARKKVAVGFLIRLSLLKKLKILRILLGLRGQALVLLF